MFLATLIVTRTFCLDCDANGPSYQAEVSGNGQYAAYISASSNLTPGDTNGQPDVFLEDLRTRERLNLTGHSSAGCWWFSISNDAGRVAYSSGSHVWLLDRASGTTVRVTRPVGGSFPAISADGRFVAYVYSGTFWTGGVVVRDIEQGSDEFIELVDAHAVSISSEGRWIGIDNAQHEFAREPFVYDRETGTLERVLPGADDVSMLPYFYAGARYLTIASYARNLASSPRGPAPRGYLIDQTLGTIEELGTGTDYAPRMSKDGRFVVSDGREGIIVLDLATGQREYLTAFNGFVGAWPTISDDGRVVVFRGRTAGREGVYASFRRAPGS